MRERFQKPPPALERVFQELEEHGGASRPVTLTEEYIRALRDVEDLPCNRRGGDKSWVLHVERRERDTLASSKRLT
jgi:hypothetical protein